MHSLREGVASCSYRVQTSNEAQHVFPRSSPFRQQNARQVTDYKNLKGRQSRGASRLRVSASAGTLERATKMPSLPFVKVADQEDMKLALMLNVIDPSIGGVLIMGERGTGKSVAVRLLLCETPATTFVDIP